MPVVHHCPTCNTEMQTVSEGSVACNCFCPHCKSYWAFPQEGHA